MYTSEVLLFKGDRYMNRLRKMSIVLIILVAIDMGMSQWAFYTYPTKLMESNPLGANLLSYPLMVSLLVLMWWMSGKIEEGRLEKIITIAFILVIVARVYTIVMNIVVIQEVMQTIL